MTDTPLPTSKELDLILYQFRNNWRSAIEQGLLGQAQLAADEAKERLTRCIEAEKARAELYGRLHQTIELFQSGQLSAGAYSKLHDELTERLSELQQRLPAKIELPKGNKAIPAYRLKNLDDAPN